MENAAVMDLEALPEGCIANVIGLMTPGDACRLSLLSRHFKSAADSDAVWDKFLPADTNEILHHFKSATDAKSKKELYLTLCDNPILIDRKMSCSLDKWSGKKSYMIPARRLIWFAGGKYPVCREMKPRPDSRFKEAAYFIALGGFEIRGRIETRLLSPCTTYKAYLVYRLTGLYHGEVVTGVIARANGFDYEGPSLREITEERLTRKEIIKYGTFPNERRVDRWLEMELGEFHCQGDEDGELEMVCRKTDRPPTKGLVQGIEIRPKRTA